MSSRYIIGGLTLLLAIFLVWYFINIVTYVMLAWVLSMIGAPLINLLEKLKFGRFRLGRSVSAIIVLCTYLIVFVALLSLFVPLIVEQARNLSGVDFQAIVKGLEEPFSHLKEYLVRMGLMAADEPLPIENMQHELVSYISPNEISNLFSSIVGAMGSAALTIASVFFIAFFFLREHGLFLRVVLAIAPSKYAEEIRHIIDDGSRMLTRYFGGVLLQITIITLIVSTGLGILGVPNALLIGFFAGLINVIPYLGPMLGGLFGMFIALSSNLEMDFYTEMLPMLGKVAIVFACVQVLDNFILQPTIFSNSVNAHPLEIFIVILVGAQVGGVTGMVLAIPIYTIVRIIARTFLYEFKVVQKLTNNLKKGD